MLKFFDRKIDFEEKILKISKITKISKSSKIEKVGFQLKFSSIFRDFQDFSKVPIFFRFFFKIDFRSKIFNLFACFF